MQVQQVRIRRSWTTRRDFRDRAKRRGVRQEKTPLRIEESPLLRRPRPLLGGYGVLLRDIGRPHLGSFRAIKK
jgi:hypothetical protein